MFKIYDVNVATYNIVLGLQAGLPSSLERTLAHEPFMLEDALGRITPVHMQFVNSWEAFDAILEVRFRNAPGYKKVQGRKYTLQEQKTRKEISRARPWDASFLPGQKIDMTLIFRSRKGESNGAVCPACLAPSLETKDGEIQW